VRDACGGWIVSDSLGPVKLVFSMELSADTDLNGAIKMRVKWHLDFDGY